MPPDDTKRASAPPAVYSLTAAEYEAQIAALAAHGFPATLLDAIKRGLELMRALAASTDPALAPFTTDALKTELSARAAFQDLYPDSPTPWR